MRMYQRLVKSRTHKSNNSRKTTSSRKTIRRVARRKKR